MAPLEFLRGLAITLLFAYGITQILLPGIIEKMRKVGWVSIDVNKPYKRYIPNLGGLAVLFGFSLALSLVVGVEKLIGVLYEPPFLAVISVFFIAAMIGLIDDIANMSDKMKIVGLLFASIPLIIVHEAPLVIDITLGYSIDLSNHFYLFWLIFVPIGVTSAANALNMSAGYNGLESGQVIIISFFVLVITLIRGDSVATVFIFGALLGCGIALYQYNRYPSKIFVGNIGTMGIGAAIASGVITGGLEFYGIICILPAFYEGVATLYYKFINPKNRRKICRNPTILKNGKLQTPKGAEYFTLSYFLLSRRPMREKELVNKILTLYIICGAAALVLSIL